MKTLNYISKTILIAILGLSLFLVFSSFSTDDCAGRAMGYKFGSFKPEPCSVAVIKHSITGLNASGDLDRKITVFYGLSSFKDGKVVGNLDATIGYETDVVSAVKADGSQDFATQVILNPSGRMDAIKAAKGKGMIDKITLTVKLYQDNRPCSSDVIQKFDVTSAF